LENEKQMENQNKIENKTINKILCKIDKSLEVYLDSKKIKKIKEFIKLLDETFDEIDLSFVLLKVSDVEIYERSVFLANLSNKVADFISKLII
jgi:hypothetical protein